MKQASIYKVCAIGVLIENDSLLLAWKIKYKNRRSNHADYQRI